MQSLNLAVETSAPSLAGVAADRPPNALLRGERAARGSFRLRLPFDQPLRVGLEIVLALADLVAWILEDASCDL